MQARCLISAAAWFTPQQCGSGFRHGHVEQASSFSGRLGVQHRNAPDQDITVPGYGTYVLRWTDVNLTCSDFDEITVNFYNNPTVAAAGADIFQSQQYGLHDGGQQCDSGHGL